MHTLSKRIVTCLIEYLGEFKFIFETILDYESDEQMGSFDVKNPPSKISCLGTFKRECFQNWRFHINLCCFQTNATTRSSSNAASFNKHMVSFVL
jgi:hypothetical protein